jgi:hypothetical protein
MPRLAQSEEQGPRAGGVGPLATNPFVSHFEELISVLDASLLSAIWRNGKWLSLPSFVASVALLGYLIRNLLRVIKQSLILAVPLVERQEVEFTAAGRLVLCGEGPLFTSRFAGLAYALSDELGRPVEGRRAWFRAKTSGVKWVRMEMCYFKIPRPGRYLLTIEGLGAAKESDARHRIMFMRPHLGRSIASIIGLILVSFMLIGSILLYFLTPDSTS